jgi:hypothetical protein
MIHNNDIGVEVAFRKLIHYKYQNSIFYNYIDELDNRDIISHRIAKSKKVQFC